MESKQERIDKLTADNRKLVKVVTELAAGRVIWSPVVVAPIVSRCPARPFRVGLTNDNVGLILQHTNDGLVIIKTPYEVAFWPTNAVRAFDGLEQYLLRHVSRVDVISVHTPEWAWIRTIAGAVGQIGR